MGWNRIFIGLPVQPHEWPAAAALWGRHLREEEKEAEDGPGRPKPSRWEQIFICVIWKITFLVFHVLIGCFSCQIFRFFCECIIWEIEYGRDWNFGGLLRDCSQATPPNDCIQFEQQLLYPNPRLLPRLSPLVFQFPFYQESSGNWGKGVFSWCKWACDLKV